MGDHKVDVDDVVPTEYRARTSPFVVVCPKGELMTTAVVLREIRRACRAHGVATEYDLRLSRRQLDRVCQSGALVRRAPGVYVDPAVPASPEQDLAVAIAVAGTGGLAAAWGRSAAAVWGLIDDHPATPEIVVQKRRRVRVAGAVVHRSSALVGGDITSRNRLRVTKPIRTAVDLGVVLSPMDVADVLVRARQLRLFEPDAVAAAIATMSRPGRNGIRTARAALDLVMIGDRPADSVLELRFHHGPGRLLPPYAYQHPVRVAGRTYYIDFAYPDLRLAIEVDGYDKRRSRRSLDDDARRANHLTLAGWTILRFTWARVVHDAAAVAAEVGAMRISLAA